LLLAAAKRAVAVTPGCRELAPTLLAATEVFDQRD
jgi:hypothetical protein